MFRAIGHVPADLKDSRIVRRPDCAGPDSLTYPIVEVQPVLDMPAVLKERPNVILIIDVAPSIVCLNAIQKTAGSVELGAVSRAAPHRNSTHGYYLLRVGGG